MYEPWALIVCDFVMAQSAFYDPLRRLKVETSWLQAEFLRAVDAGKTRQTQLACEMVVIRLHDAWARFCRELIILSAVGRTHTLGGAPLLPCNSSMTRHNMVIPELLKTYSRPLEPRWADATKCIQAGRNLGIRNLSTVSAALSAANSPAEKIRRVRNFYAHRKRGTALEAATVGVFSKPTYPIIFELANYTTGNTRIIESWVASLILVATAAVQ